MNSMLRDSLNAGRVGVSAKFQGVNDLGDITTLRSRWFRHDRDAVGLWHGV